MPCSWLSAAWCLLLSQMRFLSIVWIRYGEVFIVLLFYENRGSNVSWRGRRQMWSGRFVRIVIVWNFKKGRHVGEDRISVSILDNPEAKMAWRAKIAIPPKIENWNKDTHQTSGFIYWWSSADKIWQRIKGQGVRDLRVLGRVMYFMVQLCKKIDMQICAQILIIQLSEFL